MAGVLFMVMVRSSIRVRTMVMVRDAMVDCMDQEVPLRAIMNQTGSNQINKHYRKKYNQIRKTLMKNFDNNFENQKGWWNNCVIRYLPSLKKILNLRTSRI